MFVDTLLFVDVDGVLNVGVRDELGSPLEMSEGNIGYARKMWKKRENHKYRTCIERMLAASARTLGHGEDATYEKLRSNPNTGVSDVLVERLAILIHRMEGRGLVILTSTWRKPKYAARVTKLEAEISTKLGAPFLFHGKTELINDITPGLRLQNIGDFMSNHCCQHNVFAHDLRVLVLEDFHVGEVGKWQCGDTVVESIRAAEQYLEKRAPKHVRVSARVIHTYDEFRTPDGLQVQVGSGLTCAHFCRAHAFLCVPAGFYSIMEGSKSCANKWQGSEKLIPFFHEDANHLREHGFDFEESAWVKARC